MKWQQQDEGIQERQNLSPVRKWWHGFLKSWAAQTAKLGLNPILLFIGCVTLAMWLSVPVTYHIIGRIRIATKAIWWIIYVQLCPIHRERDHWTLWTPVLVSPERPEPDSLCFRFLFFLVLVLFACLFSFWPSIWDWRWIYRKVPETREMNVSQPYVTHETPELTKVNSVNQQASTTLWPEKKRVQVI